MTVFIIALVSFFASILTFYSGFGLGTILSAVLFIFFEVNESIAITAVVHMLNNLLKLFLVKKNIDFSVLKKFGLTSILGALIGSFILKSLDKGLILFKYNFFDSVREVNGIKLFMALILIFFVLFELIPSLKKMQFSDKYLSLGGLVSGFFGGLSGHQGALRSAFLVKSGLEKNSYIATGVAIACLVDLSRIPVYVASIGNAHLMTNMNLIIIATLSAFAGAFVGNKFLNKVTLDFVQKIISILMLLIAFLMIFGFL